MKKGTSQGAPFLFWVGIDNNLKVLRVVECSHGIEGLFSLFVLSRKGDKMEVMVENLVDKLTAIELGRLIDSDDMIKRYL